MGWRGTVCLVKSQGTSAGYIQLEEGHVCVTCIVERASIRNQVCRTAELKMRELFWQLLLSCRIVPSLQLLMTIKMLSGSCRGRSSGSFLPCSSSREFSWPGSLMQCYFLLCIFLRWESRFILF